MSVTKGLRPASTTFLAAAAALLVFGAASAQGAKVELVGGNNYAYTANGPAGVSLAVSAGTLQYDPDGPMGAIPEQDLPVFVFDSSEAITTFPPASFTPMPPDVDGCTNAQDGVLKCAPESGRISAVGTGAGDLLSIDSAGVGGPSGGGALARSFDAFGLAGGDSLTGGSKDDALTGGPDLDSFAALGDDDEIFSNDGLAETADCGDGTADVLNADLLDTGIGCESILRPPPVVPPPAATGLRAAALKKCKKKRSKKARRKCRKRAAKLPV